MSPNSDSPKPRRHWLPYDYLTKAEASAYARVSARTLQRAAASGHLEAHGTDGRRLYLRMELDAWLRRRRGQ